MREPLRLPIQWKYKKDVPDLGIPEFDTSTITKLTELVMDPRELSGFYVDPVMDDMDRDIVIYTTMGSFVTSYTKKTADLLEKVIKQNMQ